MPKVGDIKEDDRGKFIWRQPEGCEEGWWSQIEDEVIAESRTPWVCPGCGELLDQWSTSFYNRWGVCANDFYSYLDGRQNLPDFRSNKERAEFCRQKNAEKNNRK